MFFFFSVRDLRAAAATKKAWALCLALFSFVNRAHLQRAPLPLHAFQSAYSPSSLSPPFARLEQPAHTCDGGVLSVVGCAMSAAAPQRERERGRRTHALTHVPSYFLSVSLCLHLLPVVSLVCSALKIRAMPPDLPTAVWIGVLATRKRRREKAKQSKDGKERKKPNSNSTQPNPTKQNNKKIQKKN